MDRWEVFLRTLGDRVSAASERKPSARCLKPSTLRSEIRAIAKENRPALRTTFPPAHVVIEHLKRMGWVQPIKVQSPDGTEQIEFLLVDMEAGKGEPIYPLELLQSYLPGGVICFFSAITHHELTTQAATHHHIARLGPPRPKESREAIGTAQPGREPEPKERNPLGTEIFRFEDVAYYLNRRDVSLVPGIQFRVVSPRCWLRITTLEQTLLDTMLQPVRCGGEAVVLEAWEIGASRMDADRMAEHLAKMQREDLERRVGAVLNLIGADFAKTSLGHRLHAVRDRLIAQNVPDIPLLAGHEFPDWNKTWKVRIP